MQTMRLNPDRLSDTKGTSFSAIRSNRPKGCGLEREIVTRRTALYPRLARYSPRLSREDMAFATYMQKLALAAQFAGEPAGVVGG